MLVAHLNNSIIIKNKTISSNEENKERMGGGGKARTFLHHGNKRNLFLGAERKEKTFSYLLKEKFKTVSNNKSNVGCAVKFY